MISVATLALGSWPRQGLVRVWAKRARECGRMWEWTLTLPNELPFWELESKWTSKISKSNFNGENPSPWRVFYIIGKLLKRRCPKWARMIYLDICNTRWPKERLGIKLTIWLPTTESQESTRFPCVQVACNTPLKSSRRGLQLRFKRHPDQRFAQEVIVLRSCEIFNLSDFETPIWESRDKKPFRCYSHGEVQNILYGGRWWLPPSPDRGESCESEVARGESCESEVARGLS
jgi:hypothetical protein